MRDKGQQEIPEYLVVATIRRLRTDKNCQAEKSWPNHVKNELHIGSEKTYGPKILDSLNTMMKIPQTKMPSLLLLIRYIEP